MRRGLICDHSGLNSPLPSTIVTKEKEQFRDKNRNRISVPEQSSLLLSVRLEYGGSLVLIRNRLCSAELAGSIGGQQHQKIKKAGRGMVSSFCVLHSIEEQVFFSKLAKLPRVEERERKKNSKVNRRISQVPGLPGPPLSLFSRLSRRIRCLCVCILYHFLLFWPALSTAEPMKQAALTTVSALSMPMWRSSLMFLG